MKFLFSLTCLVLFTLLLQAQIVLESEKDNAIDFRAFLGFNLTSLSSDINTTEIDSVNHTTTFSARPGFEIGVAMTFGNRLYIQPGLKFVQISNEIVNKNNKDQIKYEDFTTVNFLNIPLKAGFRLINQETEDILNVRVFAGLDALIPLTVNHNEKSNKISDINKDDFQTVIFNGEIGAGVDVWIFYLDMGYQLGLTPVFSQGDINVTANTFYTNCGVRIKF